MIEKIRAFLEGVFSGSWYLLTGKVPKRYLEKYKISEEEVIQNILWE